MRALHWIRQGLMMFAILLVACPVYTLMMSMQKDALVWEDIPLLTGSFMMMSGMFFSMAFSTLLYTQDLPITISFGSTRKEAFWGIQLSRATYTLLNVLCTGLLFLLAADTPFADLTEAIPFILAGYLIFHGLSGIMAILYVKFQKKGLIAFGSMLTVILAGGLVGFLIGFNDGGFPEFPKNFEWMLLGGGALLYTLVSLWEYRIIRNYNVKL